MPQQIMPAGQVVKAAKRSHLPASIIVYLVVLVSLWGFSALPLILPSGAHSWSARALWPLPPFNDFGTFFYRIKLLHRPEFWTFAGSPWDYPAPCIFVYQFFYLFNRPTAGPYHQVFFGFLAYLAWTASSLVVAGLVLARILTRRHRLAKAVCFVSISLILCWPVYIGMQRGNIECFLDAGLACGLFAYIRRRYWLAACLVGAFGSAKLYPLLLLLLFLPRHRWKEFTCGLGVAAAFTVLAARWIGPPPIIYGRTQGLLYGLRRWVVANSLNHVDSGFEFDHSIFGLLKRFIGRTSSELLTWFVLYAIVCGVAFLVLFFLRSWRMPRPNQMLTVSLACVLLPPTSYDYTLALLLPVWAWLVLLATAPHPANRQRTFLLALASFAFLFAPETFLRWHNQLFSGQAKAIVLLCLMTLSLSVPISEGVTQDASPLLSESVEVAERPSQTWTHALRR